jgi:hypothetical protein
MTDDTTKMGEGNHEADRRYREAATEFAQSGRVEEAARDAQPKDEAEAQALATAKAKGRHPATEEDPEVTRDYSKPTKSP